MPSNKTYLAQLFKEQKSEQELRNCFELSLLINPSNFYWIQDDIVAQASRFSTWSLDMQHLFLKVCHHFAFVHDFGELKHPQLEQSHLQLLLNHQPQAVFSGPLDYYVFQESLSNISWASLAAFKQVFELCLQANRVLYLEVLLQQGVDKAYLTVEEIERAALLLLQQDDLSLVHKGCQYIQGIAPLMQACPEVALRLLMRRGGVVSRWALETLAEFGASRFLLEHFQRASTSRSEKKMLLSILRVENLEAYLSTLFEILDKEVLDLLNRAKLRGLYLSLDYLQQLLDYYRTEEATTVEEVVALFPPKALKHLNWAAEKPADRKRLMNLLMGMQCVEAETEMERILQDYPDLTLLESIFYIEKDTLRLVVESIVCQFISIESLACLPIIRRFPSKVLEQCLREELSLEDKWQEHYYEQELLATLWEITTNQAALLAALQALEHPQYLTYLTKYSTPKLDVLALLKEDISHFINLPKVLLKDLPKEALSLVITALYDFKQPEEALERLHDILGKGQHLFFSQLLIKAYQKASSYAAQLFYLEALSSLTVVDQAIAACLLPKDAHLMKHYVLALGRSNSTHKLQRIYDILQGADNIFVLRQVIIALQELRASIFEELILPSLEHRNMNIRKTVLGYLQVCGTAACIPYLLKILRFQDNKGLREEAFSILGRLSSRLRLMGSVHHYRKTGDYFQKENCRKALETLLSERALAFLLEEEDDFVERDLQGRHEQMLKQQAREAEERIPSWEESKQLLTLEQRLSLKHELQLSDDHAFAQLFAYKEYRVKVLRELDQGFCSYTEHTLLDELSKALPLEAILIRWNRGLFSYKVLKRQYDKALLKESLNKHWGYAFTAVKEKEKEVEELPKDMAYIFKEKPYLLSTCNRDELFTYIEGKLDLYSRLKSYAPYRALVFARELIAKEDFRSIDKLVNIKYVLGDILQGKSKEGLGLLELLRTEPCFAPKVVSLLLEDSNYLSAVSQIKILWSLAMNSSQKEARLKQILDLYQQAVPSDKLVLLDLFEHLGQVDLLSSELLFLGEHNLVSQQRALEVHALHWGELAEQLAMFRALLKQDLYLAKSFAQDFFSRHAQRAEGLLTLSTHLLKDKAWEAILHPLVLPIFVQEGLPWELLSKRVEEALAVFCHQLFREKKAVNLLSEFPAKRCLKSLAQRGGEAALLLLRQLALDEGERVLRSLALRLLKEAYTREDYLDLCTLLLQSRNQAMLEAALRSLTFRMRSSAWTAILPLLLHKNNKIRKIAQQAVQGVEASQEAALKKAYHKLKKGEQIRVDEVLGKKS